ncbi:hypothetical protein DFH09DRAFT_1283415 [Mycena vulgaris]|nr:hypothetical protein DFH09DRAFT_1283415 [Mycena vulgaris]
MEGMLLNTNGTCRTVWDSTKIGSVASNLLRDRGAWLPLHHASQSVFSFKHTSAIFNSASDTRDKDDKFATVVIGEVTRILRTDGAIKKSWFIRSTNPTRHPKKQGYFFSVVFMEWLDQDGNGEKCMTYTMVALQYSVLQSDMMPIRGIGYTCDVNARGDIRTISSGGNFITLSQCP